MAYKPVGVDQNGRFPTRVEAALNLLFSRRVRRGIPKTSTNVLQWGIPSVSFIGITTSALNINEIRYVPFEVRTPILLSALQFEVTTGPATAGNLAVGIYASDANHQPTGVPIYDSGSVAIAASFTGVKTVTGIAATLQPGLYLLAVNVDKALTLRNYLAPSAAVIPAMGANSLIIRHLAAQAYGTYPATPIPWASSDSGSTGYAYGILWQWGETT